MNVSNYQERSEDRPNPSSLFRATDRVKSNGIEYWKTDSDSLHRGKLVRSIPPSQSPRSPHSPLIYGNNKEDAKLINKHRRGAGGRAEGESSSVVAPDESGNRWEGGPYFRKPIADDFKGRCDRGVSNHIAFPSPGARIGAIGNNDNGVIGSPLHKFVNGVDPRREKEEFEKGFISINKYFVNENRREGTPVPPLTPLTPVTPMTPVTSRPLNQDDLMTRSRCAQQSTVHSGEQLSIAIPPQQHFPPFSVVSPTSSLTPLLMASSAHSLTPSSPPPPHPPSSTVPRAPLGVTTAVREREDGEREGTGSPEEKILVLNEDNEGGGVGGGPETMAAGEEEKMIDVCSVRETRLLKKADSVAFDRRIKESGCSSTSSFAMNMLFESTKKDQDSPFFSELGSEQCSRTVPSLMKFYSRHKKSLSTSLSVTLAVSGQATPPCSPISPGTLSSVPPPSGSVPSVGLSVPPFHHYPHPHPLHQERERSLLEASTMTSPTDSSSFSTSTSETQIPPEGVTPSLPPPTPPSSGSLVWEGHTSSNENSSYLRPSPPVPPSGTLQSYGSHQSSPPFPLPPSRSVTSSPSSTLLTIPELPTTKASTTETEPEPELEPVPLTKYNHNRVLTTTSSINYNQHYRHPRYNLHHISQQNHHPTTTATNNTGTTTITTNTTITTTKIQQQQHQDEEEDTTDKSEEKDSTKNANSGDEISGPTPSVTLNNSGTPNNAVGSLPPGITLPSPWSLPHGAIPHPGSYWLHPGQFSGVDAGAGLGLGYHMARDPITGHLFILSRPHPVPDPSGHGLLWAGYGNVPTPPMMMTPQQLLLDPRYRPSLHPGPPPIMQLHPNLHPGPPPPSQQDQQQQQQQPQQQSQQQLLPNSQVVKSENPSPNLQKEEATKESSPISLVEVTGNQPGDLSLPPAIPPPNISPHFLFPPTTIPYYFPPPAHPSRFNLPAFPHPPNATHGLHTGLPTNLYSSVSSEALSMTSVSAPAAVSTTPISSISGTVNVCGDSIPKGMSNTIASPLRTSENNSTACFEPPIDLTYYRKKGTSSDNGITTSTQKEGHQQQQFNSSSLHIKKEIKEEVNHSSSCCRFEEKFKDEPVSEHLTPRIKPEPAKIFSEEETRLLTNQETSENCLEKELSHPILKVKIPLCSEQQNVESEKIPCSPSLCNNVEYEDDGEKINNVNAPESQSAIDSSGLELLLQTFLQHGDRLAPSPQPKDLDLESVSSYSERQMPHLERATNTPSPRFSPASFESQPPVLTPFTYPPDVESCRSSPEYVNPTSSSSEVYVQANTQSTQEKPSGFSLLCALAEQRFLEEEQRNNCSALSSLAEVASSTPSVPMTKSIMGESTDFDNSPKSVDSKYSNCRDSPEQSDNKRIAQDSLLNKNPISGEDPELQRDVTYVQTLPENKISTLLDYSERLDYANSPHTLPESKKTSFEDDFEQRIDVNCSQTSVSKSSVLEDISDRPDVNNSQTSPLDGNSIWDGLEEHPTNVNNVEKPEEKSLLYNTTSSPVHQTMQSPIDNHIELRNTDINRNYKSPESEREARAFIANKVSQYQKDTSGEPVVSPVYPTEGMDPSEIDMRMKLADLQRQYKEKQRELSRLPKREGLNGSLKRRRGRPPKLKNCLTFTGEKRKAGRPQKRMRLDESPSSDICKNNRGDEKIVQDTHSMQSPNSTEFSNDERESQRSNIIIKTWQPKSEESSDDEEEDSLPLVNSPLSLDTRRPSLASPPYANTTETKPGFSDEENLSSNDVEKFLSVKHSIQTEASVESSTSDAEFHSTSSTSSSKKRKPGRPKKHSPTKYDATETIVDKKQKSLEFLLLSHKSKIRPKLKAELKIRVGQDQEDSVSNETKEEESHETMIEDEGGAIMKIGSAPTGLRRPARKLKAWKGVKRRGAPMGRTPLSRNTLLRDKEKRKKVFEKNSRMQELFRSLKRYSTIAAAEHDESEDEKEENDVGESLRQRRGAREDLSGTKKPPLTITKVEAVPEKVEEKEDSEELECEEVEEEAASSSSSTAASTITHHHIPTPPEKTEDAAMTVVSSPITITSINTTTTDSVSTASNTELSPCIAQTTSAREHPHTFCIPSNPDEVDIKGENASEVEMVNMEEEKVRVKVENPSDPPEVSESTSTPSLTPPEECQIKQEVSCDVETAPESNNDVSTGNEEIFNTGVTEEPEKESSVCSLQVEDLVPGARILILQDGLLYAGGLTPITPPDVYGIHVDGERGTRPHICCQEELLTQAWKEVKPGSTRFLTEGTRVCAFWSQQYRGLYPGCVAAACSPTHEGNHNLVNVEFDDGDSGRIHVDDIRLLPQDFPVIEYDPNPLMTLNKRKRRPTEESSSCVQKSNSVKNASNRDSANKGATPIQNSSTVEEGVTTELSSVQKKEKPSVKEDERDNEVSAAPAKKERQRGKRQKKKRKKQQQNRSCSSPATTSGVAAEVRKRRHKKRKKSLSPSPYSLDLHMHKHKRKRKHKHRRKASCRRFPHVEQGENELRMRIKSPPPLNEEDEESSSEEESSTDDDLPADEDYTPQPIRKNKRSPSEKSKIAPFLLERQLWKWSGKGYRRPGAKGKGKKEFYKEIVRGKENIRVGDCAVFLSSGSHERPFIGKIDFLWEAWGGNMVVKVRWFYHPDETHGTERKLAEPRGALFSSSHSDENDVQTISHKCLVVPLAEYRARRAELDRKHGPDYENYDLYYLAGHYDPTYLRITMEPGVS